MDTNEQYNIRVQQIIKKIKADLERELQDSEFDYNLKSRRMTDYKPGRIDLCNGYPTD